MNRLASERSSYLQHAARQKIDWYPWSEEPFDRARQENKPVFLSTGAVWCHWCHVMARESFEDDDTAGLLNGHFISVKLDRDERPDIDRRYQQAVAALGGGSGWPLSVFLTPDKRPFFGGTYFPPDDMQGRPGFKNVLRKVSAYYRENRERVEDLATQVIDALKPEAAVPADLDASMIDEALRSMMAVNDARNGGFGGAPKFPMPGALEFLIRRSRMTGDASAGNAARRMLEAMADGGFHDQLGGGFHRYSVDEAWTIPHFEKMADDNAGLLKNYVDGYARFGDERFRDIARGIIRFSRDVLSDPEGGFYASQDADVTPNDEGGYFTWTDAELKAVLDHEEYPLLSLYLLHEQGSMHHEPARNVLFVTRSLLEVAASLGMNEDLVRRTIDQGKQKMLTARAERTTPFIDRALYTSLNGMMISAYFHAYAVLGDRAVRDFAIKSLERILDVRVAAGLLMHSDGVPAMLDDHAHLIEALVAAYEVTGSSRYLDLSAQYMEESMKKYLDGPEGGFFDTEQEVLGSRLKRIEDVPHASANTVMIRSLLKLARITGGEQYQREAERALKIFAGPAASMGPHAGSYFSVLDASYRMVTLTVEAAIESELAHAARALAGREHIAIIYAEDKGRVIPCKGNACLEPVSDTDKMKTLFDGR